MKTTTRIVKIVCFALVISFTMASIECFVVTPPEYNNAL
jgi:hypothetical protein